MKILPALPALLLLLSPLAMSAPIPATIGGLTDSGDELFSPTDLNGNADSSTFFLSLEFGSFNTDDHEFGIFQYDEDNDAVVAGSMLAVLDDTFNAIDDPFGIDVTWDTSAATMSTGLGLDQVTKSYDPLLGLNSFGFYFVSDIGGGVSTFYSVASLNPSDEDLFGMYWNPVLNGTPDLYVFASDNDSGSCDDVDANGDPTGLADCYTVAVLDVQPVPEPSIIALLGLGLVGVGFARRRRIS